MKRFMIGQFDRFDINRQNRDFRDYFFGIEVNQMESLDELQILKDNIRDRNLKIGIHFPLLKNQWRARDPQYLSKDNRTYEESINYMESEFERAEQLNPDYILLHYPKPVILDGNVDWSSWRFCDDTEYYYESDISYNYFEERSRNFFKILSQQGKKYNFTPVLELDGLNKYIYETNLLEDLLDEYSNIKLCLDFGRIHLQDCIDDSFIGQEIVRKFGRYTHLVHLWNVKIDINVTNAHYPALKSLKTADGWGDMESYFKILNEVNNNYKVLFEHKSHLISDAELEECYQWIGELVNS
ncbi:TIM barrel protein [Clostridium tagluense]|uniref:TIM barrel protein n=1 Tax=Clostridium tagluense TaxID=360422 RepID=UPI001CF54593|nr:TIM barrel protein [Clostridium tagluense]MCB2297882.1 sugar phosphate isomerase/epimerase [Clostridium tagluense]